MPSENAGMGGLCFLNNLPGHCGWSPNPQINGQASTSLWLHNSSSLWIRIKLLAVEIRSFMPHFKSKGSFLKGSFYSFSATWHSFSLSQRVLGPTAEALVFSTIAYINNKYNIYMNWTHIMLLSSHKQFQKLTEIVSTKAVTLMAVHMCFKFLRIIISYL